jgi:hypothetical protein
MKLVHLSIIALVAAAYSVTAFLVSGHIPKTSVLALISASGIVLLSSFFMIAPKNGDPAAPAQRFIIGTTVQLLLSLAFLAYAKFRLGGDFKTVAIHFLALFICCLVAQSILLLVSLRK